MKTYVQDGKTITHSPTAAVASGGVALIGVMLAIAMTTVAADETAEFLAEGVFELPKASADEIAIGAQLYWDATNSVLTVTATDNTPAGKAWAAAANGDTTVVVKINA